MMRTQSRYRRSISKNLIYSVLVLLVIGLAYVLQQGSVKASSLINWTAGPPIVNSNYSTSIGNHATNQPDCTYQKISIRSKYAGISSTSEFNGCVVRGKNLSLAHTSDGLYVSFGSDNYFYKFHTDNTGIVRYQTVLTPGGDRIAFVMDMIGQKSIRVYDNFSSRLTLDKDTLRYRMTNWDDQLFPADEQTTQRGVSINLSNNGHYAVYQSADDWPGASVGVIRVDLETGEEKQFGYAHYSTYASPLPTPHYAISNDGNTVAGGGISIMAVWSLSDACVKDPIINSNHSAELCPSRGISNEDYGEPDGDYWSGGARTNAVQLSDDASELSFLFTLPNSGGYKQISLSPFGYVPPASQLDYLALGDSYSSGEGDTERDKRTNEKYYRPGTDVEEVVGWSQAREKCHVSTRSYPYILSKGMSLGDPLNNSSTRWQSVACSGATVSDIYSEGGELYKGQRKGGDKPWSDSGNIPRLESYDVDVMKATALNEFVPGRQQQIEFVRRYKPKVITLTIGGNDVGFSTKLRECLTDIGTCDVATEDSKADLGKELVDQFDNLVPFYKKLYEASGNTAKIFVLGYPQFINGNTNASCGVNVGALNDEERIAIGASISYLNNVIKRASRAAGVKYIDVEDSLQNGRLCDEGQAYMTGTSFISGNEIQESFHPNAKGNNQIALKVWENVNHESLLDYDICPDTDLNSCPDEAATKDTIIVPPYFQGEEPAYTVKYSSDMTSETSSKGTPIQVARTSYSFSPGSTVKLTLFSEPTDLGTYSVENDGALNIGVQIPGTVPAGYHTLIVDGLTYSGEPIRYEQVIFVRGADPTDIDENGTADSQQLCGPFFVASGVDADLDGIDDSCDPQISEKPELYRWRLGYLGRIYNNNPENENQIYIERNIWAGNLTGTNGDYDPEGDGWAVVGVSSGNQLDGLDVKSIGSTVDFEVLGGGISGDPYQPIIYVHPGSLQCRAYRPTDLSRVLVGESRSLSAAKISNDKCPQVLEPNLPAQGGLLSKIKNSLLTIRSQLNAAINLISALLVQVRRLLALS